MIPHETNKTPIATNPSKSIIDLSVFIFRKVTAKAIVGNNNIAFGKSAWFHFFITVSSSFNSR